MYGALALLIAIALFAGYLFIDPNTREKISSIIDDYVSFVSSGIEEWKALATGEYYEYKPIYTTKKTEEIKPLIVNLIAQCDGPKEVNITDTKFDINLTVNVEDPFFVKEVSVEHTGLSEYYTINVEKKENKWAISFTKNKDPKPGSYSITFLIKYSAYYKEILPILVKTKDFDFVHIDVKPYLQYYVKPKSWEVYNNGELEFVFTDPNALINIREAKLAIEGNGINIQKMGLNKIKISLQNLKAYAIIPLFINASITYQKSITPIGCTINIKNLNNQQN